MSNTSNKSLFRLPVLQTVEEQPKTIPNAFSSEKEITVLNIPVFPTGKDSISYSEINTWQGCGWRHKLRYIDKIDLDKKSDDILIGEIVHAYFENFIKDRKFLTKQGVIDFLKEEWNGLVDKEKLPKEIAKAEDMLEENTIIQDIVKAFPAWLESEFPKWEFVNAEELLFETIEGVVIDDVTVEIKFKGYIDAIIRVADSSAVSGYKYHIIDWKTTRYWSKEKRADFFTRLQLALYKMFWSKKHEIPLEDISCHFGLVKKQNKKEWFELFTVEIDESMMIKSLKTVRSMIKTVMAGKFFKNKDSCQWCVYKKTVWCL